MSSIKTVKFTKMQGIGNDYVYIDCTKQMLDLDIANLAVKISDRHFGVGSDGLVLILLSNKADFMMRMFNSDGSEAEMCGNAIRCVGKYAYERGLTNKDTISIETLAGIKVLKLNIKDEKVVSVIVDMGEPVLAAEKIPVISRKGEFVTENIQVDDNFFALTCVSMGNPHAVTFMDNINEINIERLGPSLENNSIFPKKTNVEFVKVIDRQTLEMRVWERGAGETLACGTGACATVVAAVLNNLCDRKSVVKLIGGELQIEWDEKNNHVFMTGPAQIVFDGEYYIS